MNWLRLRCWIWVVVCVMQAGCATHISPKMVEMINTPLPIGKARIVMLRSNHLNELLSFTDDLQFSMDGIDNGFLGRGSYQVLDVAPGPHVLELWRPPSQTIVKVFDRYGRRDVVVSAGKVLYFRCLSVRNNNMTIVLIVPISEKEGKSAIADINQAIAGDS